jgi:radical SAM protein with 4Fe4S-binding SPASM domain
MAAIRHAIDAGLHTELHFVPMASNYRQLAPLAEIAKRIGVQRISVLRFVPQGRGAAIGQEVLSPDQNRELRAVIQRLVRQGHNIRTGSPYNFLMLRKKPECAAGIDRLTIAPDLRIYPCDAFKQVKAERIVNTARMSSLKGASLKDCWDKSPYLLKIREFLTTDFGEPCRSCDALNRCVSGCLAQKFLAHGHLKKAPDPMCLKMA